MKVKEELLVFKKEFDTEVVKLIEEKKKEAGKLDRRYQVLMEVLADFVERGGKRLRPAFMYFGYLAGGGKEKKRMMKAAVCVELLHAFLLIHDDLVDRSDLRRGKPTAHRMFEQEFVRLKLKGDKEHFGRSVAMILGDVVHALAYEVLMESGFTAVRLVKARRLFDNLMFETAYGWYAELLNTMGSEAREKEIERAMEYVSARYTIAGPLKLGAILAGAGEKKIKAVEEFGLKLGLAFQIQDDILGMFGAEEKVGKPVDSDMKEGKKTLLWARLAEKLRGKERQKLLNIYGSQAATKQDYLWVRQKMEETGVVEEVKARAKGLVEEALAELEQVKLERKGKEFLMGVAEFMVKREV